MLEHELSTFPFAQQENLDASSSNHVSIPLGENRPVVQLSNLHKTYLLGIEGVPALRGVDLEIRQGEFVIVYGTSGGGKTSLLNLVGTIDAPTKGGLILFDTRIDRKTKEKDLANIRMKRMGFVFQTFNLIPSMTALENVELPMILMGVLNKAQRFQRAKELMERVGVAQRMNHLPSQLSGGEQQRVTIARALANSPDLLLLDEPTGDLDTHNTDRVMSLLMNLNAEGITMLMVTHDDSLRNCAHRVVHMLDGRVQRVMPVLPIERRAQISRLQNASRSLRTGITKEGQDDSLEITKIPNCSLTTIRTPQQYTMHPVPMPCSPSQSSTSNSSQKKASASLETSFS
eukprot:c3921_g1_i1.p1 GENE.c3921_g1_i1~~c3921_g1_i1.p1  ORF type:complete len:345 (+),score=52.77 c3921_g1_i1:142-1176(+)